MSIDNANESVPCLFKSTEPGAAASTEKVLIAVVDDEAHICKALRRLLRSVGFEVVTFCSGQEFLRSIQERCPACLIIDVHLPGLTGLDVQCHLSAIRAAFPVVVITGGDEPGLRERVMAAGASAFLLKPVDGGELLEVMQRLLSH